MAPRASRFAWELWIVPRRHEPDFTRSGDACRELARLMQLAVRAIRLGSGCSAYNWNFMNGTGRFHWYLEITPRLTIPGGFELASGTFINVIAPEDAAAAMRPHFSVVE